MTLPRLLFINRSYWPDSEATGQLLTQLAEDLAGEFDVHVLTGQPNHVQAGEAYLNRGEESRNGVTIHRIAHTQFNKRSMAGKLANLVSFTLAAWRQSIQLDRADVVITETDPFFLGLLGRRLQRAWNCRFIAYLQDIYPDIAVAVGKARESWMIRQLRSRLFGAYRAADRVVVLSEDMRQRCMDRGVDQDRLRIVPNWADIDAIRPVEKHSAFRMQQELGDRFVAMYSGNLGLAHVLEPIIDAAERLKDDPRFLILFVGEGVQKAKLQQLTEAKRLSNVRFLPYQPRESLSESLGAADVHLVSVLPAAVPCLMPSKLYGVLAAGRPAVTMAPAECELSRIVQSNEVGVVCAIDPAESLPDRLAAALRQMADSPARLDQLGRNARQLAESRYTRRHSTTAFRDMLAELVPAADFVSQAPA